MPTKSGTVRCPKCGRGKLLALLTLGDTKAECTISYRGHPKQDKSTERCAQGVIGYRGVGWPKWAESAVTQHLKDLKKPGK